MTCRPFNFKRHPNKLVVSLHTREILIFGIMSDEEIDSDEEAPYDEESEDEGLVEMSDEDSEEPAEEEADPDAEDDESEGSDDADNDVSEELTTGTILHVNQCACVRQDTANWRFI